MSKLGLSSTEDFESWIETSDALLSCMVSYTFFTLVPGTICRQ